jgi:predicted RND superfamily exporter protein
VRAPAPLVRFFERVVARRVAVAAAWAALVPVALLLALHVPEDHAIERMVVASDPDVRATRDFHALFPEKPTVVLLAETPAPFSDVAVNGLRRLSAAVDAVPRVEAVSLLSIVERLEPAVAGAPDEAASLRAFFARAPELGRQGFAGDDFLGVVLSLDVADARERDLALRGVEDALRAFEHPEKASAETAPSSPSAPSPFRRVRRVGEPFVDAWLERETAAASARSFPLFGLFIVVLVLVLYRSVRALAAILLTLGVGVLGGAAVAGVCGWSSSIVSALVPLTLMITATAALVYLHTRYVDRPDDVPIEVHRVHALANKFLPVTASIFATAVGFAALAVSPIRPIREMGLWTAGGLAVVWAACFTLYPALQVLLGAPARAARATAGAWTLRLADALPRFTYRWRFALVAAALGIAVLGAIAVFGWPSRLAPMPLETDALDYVDRGATLYDDARFFEARVAGLASLEAWVRTEPGKVLDPELLFGLTLWSAALERDPRVGAVVGLPSVLRFRHLARGGEPAGGDAAPTLTREDVGREAADLEQLLLVEKSLRSFVDVGSLASTHLIVVARAGSQARAGDLLAALDEHWRAVAAREPALARATMRPVGQGLVAAKIATHLVPTLVQSFALTAAIIFVTFFAVFRSASARLMAMVPSLFAILAMFLVMRVAGIPLNVATILIATTILGATENDQIHFFYHFQERRRNASCEEALRHALRVAGSAIAYATLINAGGFLALALSPLPPMRQFGVLASSAFVLAMVADFTALPAALWIVFRERPDAPGARDTFAR